jgi:predicted kinase
MQLRSAGKLRITCGMPGAGKSTWASRQDGLVLTADIIRTQGQNPGYVFDQLYERCRAGLRAGQTVVVDTCAMRAGDRLTLRRFAVEARASAEVIVFTTPWHECKLRDHRRGAQASKVAWHEMQTRMAEAMRVIPNEPWDTRTYVPTARRISEVCWSKPVL